MREEVPSIEQKCPACDRGRLVNLTRTEEFDYDLGDETVKVRAENVPVKQCNECGEVLTGPAAAEVRHQAVCRMTGRLTPMEIKSLREKFDWSQQHLADLTSLGVATISRLERGRLMQNRSTDKLLRAIRDCPAFRDHLEELLVLERTQQGVGRTSINQSSPTSRLRCLVPNQTQIERNKTWRPRRVA